MSRKKVYAAALYQPEYDLKELTLSACDVSTMKELFSRAPGALFCIDTRHPEIRIFPNNDELLVAEHAYLFVLEDRFREWKGVLPKPIKK